MIDEQPAEPRAVRARAAPPAAAGLETANITAQRLYERFRRSRQTSLELAAPLSPEDMVVQSQADSSPTKWHLAHVTWFYETFVLTPHLPGYAPFDPLFGYLFNSYYEAVGPRRARPTRGLVTRPSVDEVLSYRAHVDEGVRRLLAGADLSLTAVLAPLFDLGAAHEEQHQELLLMDALHLLAQMPQHPASLDAPAPPASAPGPMKWIAFAGGITEVGHAGEGFAFDNEGPRHQALLQPYRLADRMVTNGEWLSFMEDGGYRRAEFWLSDGWAAVQAEGWEAPAYWERLEDGGWGATTLRGFAPVDRNAAVSHVSYYEADAYAAWAGARLPTEFEWEHAAEGLTPAGNLLGAGRLVAGGAAPGQGKLRQMFGDGWEWTRSAYLPYPGFKPAAGAIGEYNGKFMVSQQVLKGGCAFTPDRHIRASYRNFFQPQQRWMLSGVRLAKDGVGEDQALRDAALTGLAAKQKFMPAKFFYDEAGSALFEEITALPEYYPTRTEIALLQRVAGEIAAGIDPGAVLVEYGSGASVKTRILLDAAPQVAVYVPMDISPDALAQAAAAIHRDYPQLIVTPLEGDFTEPLTLPGEAAGRPRTGFFPGSTIGNFDGEEAVRFLTRARALLGAGARFLVGADMVKDEATLVAAYDDAQGVTAAFNKNLLVRLNRELEADFDLDAFAHRAVWNADAARIEMHLESLRAQTVTVAGRKFRFEAGETIHTENSHKFTPERVAALAEAGGWTVLRQWISEAPQFGVFLLQAE